MYVLVYIVMLGTTPMSVNAMGPGVTFDDMSSCFFARENLAKGVGGEIGYFPVGKQGICVQIEKVDS